MREKIRTETAKKVADKKLADYLASLTEKDIVDSYFLDNDTFTIRFSSYGKRVLLITLMEIFIIMFVDFFAEIWLDECTFHYIFVMIR